MAPPHSFDRKSGQSPMNMVPVLSIASPAGKTRGAPENTTFAAPVRLPLPSPINSTIRPPPLAGRSPTNRFPVESRARTCGLFSVMPGVKAGVLVAIWGGKGSSTWTTLLPESATKTVPFLETTMAWGLLYLFPRVCCASMTMDGTCAQLLEAPMARVRTERHKSLEFELKYPFGNFDGIANMAAALLYNFGSVTPSLRGG